MRGLRLVTAPLPHLAGLAAAVRVSIDERVPTMGVFASGRMVANPAFVARLKDNELIFVLAHELLHLALRTHDRAKGSGRLEFNYAHDYIINDILRVALGFTGIPAGGLDMPGAREKSAEQIVLDMRRNADKMASKSRVFEGEHVTLAPPVRRGLRRAAGPAGRRRRARRQDRARAVSGRSGGAGRARRRRCAIWPPGAWRWPRRWTP